MEHVFTDENFEAEVLGSQAPVFVDFWAPWCGPCKVMSPMVAAIAGELGGRVTVGTMNVDESGKTPQAYGIMSIPTFILFKEGKEVARVSGSMEQDRLKAWIEERL
ncbi:MAG: thioredoxin [Candidatus Parcubacteria bacterium]|jgi:thioredoxin 1